MSVSVLERFEGVGVRSYGFLREEMPGWVWPTVAVMMALLVGFALGVFLLVHNAPTQPQLPGLIPSGVPHPPQESPMGPTPLDAKKICPKGTVTADECL